MFIALSDETYIRPHKHLNKSESLHVLEGSADVVFFDEKGKITKIIDFVGAVYLIGFALYIARPLIWILLNW